MAKTVVPDNDPIIAKLDRIIELLEQKHAPVPYPTVPYSPVPYLAPYQPYYGPYWSVLSGQSVASPAIKYTTYNTTKSG